MQKTQGDFDSSKSKQENASTSRITTWATIASTLISVVALIVSAFSWSVASDALSPVHLTCQLLTVSANAPKLHWLITVVETLR